MTADEMIGLWTTLPFTSAAMEATDLALLADGTGWTHWSGCGRPGDLTTLTWRRLGDDTLSIRELEYRSLDVPSDEPDRLVVDGPPTVVDEEFTVRYELVRERPAPDRDPVDAVRFDRRIYINTLYALFSREVTTADMPVQVSGGRPDEPDVTDGLGGERGQPGNR